MGLQEELMRWFRLKAEKRIEELEAALLQAEKDALEESEDLVRQRDDLSEQLKAVTQALEEAIKLAKRRNNHA